MFPVWSLCLNAHSNIDLSLSLVQRKKSRNTRYRKFYVYIYIFFTEFVCSYLQILVAAGNATI